MIGQGRPKALSRRRRGLLRARFWLCAALLSFPSAAPAQTVTSPAEDESAAPLMQLRITWGGGSAQQWQGTIRVEDGAVQHLRTLALEPDSPGSIWTEADSQVRIQERSPRTYSGADVTIQATLENTLHIELAAAESPATRMAISLRDLLAQPQVLQLDESGNRLGVERLPSDQLRLDSPRSSLVFNPGETWRCTLRPHLLNSSVGNRARIQCQLIEVGSGRQHWATEAERSVDSEAATIEPLELSIPVPANEGVYTLVIEARPRSLRQRLTLRPAGVERRVQIVVLDKAPLPNDSSPWKQVLEIDPTHSRWWDRLAGMDWIAGLRRGPLGNGDISSWQHQLGPMMQLGPVGSGPKTSWEAYPLPLDEPGRPHILEIEFPSDVPQSLGISIIEPNAAGIVTPIGLDSGVYVPDEAAIGPTTLQRHRIPFWPRTKTPLVLLTNRRDGSRAVYGKIRLLAGPQHLPPVAEVRETATDTRLVAAYMERPLVGENFGAPEGLDVGSNRSLDDWNTFFHSGRRLTEYLRYSGLNGLMLPVLSDGGTLYPSRMLEPTARYDTGVYFADSSDVHPKDSLELLLRLFDREQLRLIPTLQFCTPLPRLEAALRDDPTGSHGIRLIGTAGRPIMEMEASRGRGAWYNILDPRVQQEIRDVVEELLQRSAAHKSFAGVAIDISADSYARLPGVLWGLDDDTIARFARDSGLQVPGAGESRYLERGRFLNQHRGEWIAWRAEQLEKFYLALRDQVRRVRPEASVYLVGSNLFGSSSLEQQLIPTLPSRASADELLLAGGIDGERLARAEGIVLSRPARYFPTQKLADAAIDLELNRSASLDRICRQQPQAASLLYHEPQRLRLNSFDDQSPFPDTYTWLLNQPLPAGPRNRQRFVHAIATLDPQVILDGGWLIPLGQEASSQGFITAYSRLPAVAFQNVPGQSQPVSVRMHQGADHTYVYLANNFDWDVVTELTLELPAGTKWESLTPGQTLPSPPTGIGTWKFALQPYDFVAIRFETTKVNISEARTVVSADVERELKRRIDDLGDRAAAIGNQAAHTLTNGDFETPVQTANTMQGWSLRPTTAAKIELDPQEPHSGISSLKLTSTGTAVSLVSDPLKIPATGRISMSVWLRVPSGEQPAMHLALEGRRAGSPYYRHAPLGSVDGSPKLQSEWSQYVFQVTDLPLTGLDELRVRFDLLGEGEVWIDDIELFELWLTDSERVELGRLITTAQLRLEAGQYNDCMRLLGGYWPRFLMEYVPLSETPIVDQPPRPTVPREARQPEPRRTFSDRLYDLLPQQLRF